MPELTKEQLHLAREAYYWALKGNDPCGFTVETVDRALRAAAPHLQLPWESPTTAEIDRFYGQLSNYDGTRVDRETLKRTLQYFIAQRNCDLQPKPVDPRREKVIKILETPLGPTVLGVFHEEAKEYADRILAALDEVK